VSGECDIHKPSAAFAGVKSLSTEIGQEGGVGGGRKNKSRGGCKGRKDESRTKTKSGPSTALPPKVSWYHGGRANPKGRKRLHAPMS